MAKFVKNTDSVEHKWGGQYVQPDTYYGIENIEEGVWSNDAQLLADMASGTAVVAKSDDGTTDFSDLNLAINYLKDISIQDDKGRCVVTQAVFGVNEYRFRGLGVRGTATAGATTNIDTTIQTDPRYINGGMLILENHHTDDTLCFQVVHPVAGVLDEFVTDWCVDPSINTQAPLILKYVAKLPVGLILRIAYTSAGTTDVTVKMNYHLQKDY